MQDERNADMTRKEILAKLNLPYSFKSKMIAVMLRQAEENEFPVIYYDEDDWKGIIFSHNGGALLKGTDIVYLSCNFFKAHTYEGLKSFLRARRWLYEHKNEIHAEYLAKFC